MTQQENQTDESSNLSRATESSRGLINEKIVNALWQLRNLKQSSQKSYAKKIKFFKQKHRLEKPALN